MTKHYRPVANANGGYYPEDFYPTLAEAWRIFASEKKECPELDVIVESNHKLTLVIAKSYRAKLVDGMESMSAVVRSMEISQGSETN